MRILDWTSLSDTERHEALARPQFQLDDHVQRLVREVVERVKQERDAAVRAFTERFDRVWLESAAVSAFEFQEARTALNKRQIEALTRAIANVARFHAPQVLDSYVVETERGVRCEELVRPLSSVGLYVPGGTAPLPSSVIMLGVPARLAGCGARILCTPPGRGGRVHPAVLVAAELCGIEAVFKVGGAQAIAALAYGTETIPKVRKIFGPGNAYVAAAKAIVASDPEGAVCDLPAGPSEVMIVADATARAAFVAADLLSQAEHDALAQALLVTDSGALAEDVAHELSAQRSALTRSSILSQSLAACRALIVPDLATGLDIANMYAPEHLILQVREPRHWLAHVESAGSVFLGPWTAEAFGDYCSGTNHVLPTFGYARALSGLSVRDFVRTMSVQEISADGASALGNTAIILARLEGLDAHAAAVARRLAAASSETAAAADEPTVGEPGSGPDVTWDIGVGL
jgi:histidinol dehydrogenase